MNRLEFVSVGRIFCRLVLSLLWMITRRNCMAELPIGLLRIYKNVIVVLTYIAI
jgi:hypothetical protein